MSFALPLFLILAALVAIIGVFVISLFLRYRFKGDLSIRIVVIFIVLFVASLITTLII